MRQYADVLAELKDKAISSYEGDFYDFVDLPLEKEFSEFFAFGQEYLDRDDLGFSIEPARLYFNTVVDVNALARESNGYNLVEICKGSLYWIHRFYVGKTERFTHELLKNFISLTDTKGVEPGFFLFQLVSIYFLYHEVGHLIQRTQSKVDYVEFINPQLTEEEVRIRHMRELDADWHSAHCMSMHVIQFAEVEINGEKIATEDNILEVASLALSGLYMYYIDRSDHHADIYFEQHSHPHPSVRLSYMVNFFLDNLQGNLKTQIDKGAILLRAIQISELLMIEDDRNIIEEHSIRLYGQLNNVEQYIRTIIRNTDTYPSLCVHILKNN